MRYVKNPVAQFLAAGIVVLVVVVVVTLQLSGRAADSEAINDARSTTELLARSVAQPAIPRGLADGDPGAVDRFDRTALSRLLVGNVQRIKIWTADGRIVYSDETRLIGDRFPLGDDEREVLDEGTSDAELSDLDEPENRFEPKGRSLLEVYTRVVSPEGEPLLFEAYYSAADVARRQQQVYDAFQPIALGGLLLFVAITTPLVWALTRRLERTGRDRMRLLESAADASEAERRRIARDLHDGVVQDLVGTSFALSAAVRDPATEPETARRLEPMADSLRVQPALAALPARRDLPARTSASTACPPPSTTWSPPRPARACTPPSRCTTSRARPRTPSGWCGGSRRRRSATPCGTRTPSTSPCRSAGSADRITLDVTDDGVGFDPRQDAAGVGLRGLRDLIGEAGGRLEVRSRPGAGTTVHLEVAR